MSVDLKIGTDSKSLVLRNDTDTRKVDGTGLWHHVCLGAGMIVILFIIFGSVVAGIVLERFVAATAPLGYQDEDGFHFGSERVGAMKNRRTRKSNSVRPQVRLQPGLPVAH